ncbi:MAG: hypothetical protein HZB09_02010 [Candidatus Yonathbacteria bacterium]|nr:hypothetical protein [Candidatus Yonathbacteria bacterium]
MSSTSRAKKILASIVVLVSLGTFASVASANHTWGNYHWARTANPFTLKLGNNVSSAWNMNLLTASNDWSLSSMLDANIVPGLTDGRRCRATNGRVEVCNSKYGNNGWLGIASIWVNGDHITKGTVKLNDTYFNTAAYNTPAWRQFVACQEIGHAFGLDHQDVNFSNANLGTCMDYTNDPDGTLYGQLDNQHPNQHDYDELGVVYQHLDTFTTALSSVFGKKSSVFASTGLSAVTLAQAGEADDIDTSNPAEWGKTIQKERNGRSAIHERDLGKGQKVFTFVVWAN